jgi:holo-[acyl-carrier protein] synthase
MPRRFKCGVDHVAVARIQKFVDPSTVEDLKGIFSQLELDYAGQSKNRYGRLAARFAAKEACLKLFPRETAIGSIDLSDFSVQNDDYGAPHIILSSKANTILELHGLEGISISLSHTKGYAMAMAIATYKEVKAPLIGRLTNWFLPDKRKAVIGNLGKIYSKALIRAEIKTIAQEHYARMARALFGFINFKIISKTKE